jgi:hypothetical protein
MNTEQQVITMLVRTNIYAKDLHAYRERFLFICQEDKHSHAVQQYSGKEISGAPIEEVFNKAGSVPLTHPFFETKFLGSVKSFLDANQATVQLILNEATVMNDQLHLCRAVFYMLSKDCTAKEALIQAQKINDQIIEIQRALEIASTQATMGTAA